MRIFCLKKVPSTRRVADGALILFGQIGERGGLPIAFWVASPASLLPFVSACRCFASGLFLCPSCPCLPLFSSPPWCPAMSSVLSVRAF